MATESISKRVFLVGGKGTERSIGAAGAMGSKAHSLARMAAIGLPVPQAFVLSTGYCSAFSSGTERAQEELQALLDTHAHWLEEATGLAYGGARKPLLVSVRSGGPASMPGMMDTLLNVGLTDTTVRGFLRMTGNPRLVWDSYRRLIQSFAETVHGIGAQAFEAHLADCLKRAGVSEVRELDSRSLCSLAHEYLGLYRKLTGEEFPQAPMAQLQQAVRAVFRSWNSARAVEYRSLHGIEGGIGTAATVQRMVFGNAGGMSGSGVAFTRDPATGENAPYMDFLFNAQGEDIVSGRCRVHGASDLAIVLPQVHQQLAAIGRALESEFRDMQEFEFTIQEGTLFLLQTRAGKRADWAALRIAVEQVHEGLISVNEALRRLESLDLERIEDVRRVNGDTSVLCSAIPASIGVISGAIALDAERAALMAQGGEPVILVRHETSTSDIAGIAAAAGLLTAQGGRTSHAAVVARQLGKVCLVGCTGLEIDVQSRSCVVGGVRFAEGQTLGLDANNGCVFTGYADTAVEKPTAYLEEVKRWKNPARAVRIS